MLPGARTRSAGPAVREDSTRYQRRAGPPKSRAPGRSHGRSSIRQVPPASSSRPSPAPDGDVALVLDAGGARSAYQVGVLEVLLPELERRGTRPTLQLGTSAGALLAASLTSTAHLDAEEQVERLVATLGQATKRHVIRPLWQQVPVVALRYASETLGLSVFRLRGLFGTGPLARTLGRAIRWESLHDNLDQGRVHALSVVATAVRTGEVVMFTETAPAYAALPAALGSDGHRRYVRTRLGVEHLMASSAIPALFPSVRVGSPEEASGWYADGATRRRVPLAPALELGAERIVAIGTGSLHPRPADPTLDRAPVDLGDGGATLLGAVMDDPMRHDLRRLAETNAMAADDDLRPALDRHRAARGREAYRVVPYVAVAPEHGDDLSDTALAVFRENHKSWRGTLSDPDLQVVHRLLGSDSPLQGELLSYLLFDPDFFDAARDLGRRDGRAWLAGHPDLWQTGPIEAPTG